MINLDLSQLSKKQRNDILNTPQTDTSCACEVINNKCSDIIINCNGSTYTTGTTGAPGATGSDGATGRSSSVFTYEYIYAPIPNPIPDLGKICLNGYCFYNIEQIRLSITDFYNVPISAIFTLLQQNSILTLENAINLCRYTYIINNISIDYENNFIDLMIVFIDGGNDCIDTDIIFNVYILKR